MNIKEAKEEIKNSVRAYLRKDETGAYCIPVEKQRPLLLIGAPGIGKTAIMEQIAEEMGINLVSYTITHHTRQSAIGLPFITRRSFDGQEYPATEYTMSEIVAAVYEQIERSGIREGILFLDEINCVSETLAPTMLQFLQYKTFGRHQIPEGFLIAAAGNPPEYNRSVREFDIVTLDRVRMIRIQEDFSVWKEYAYRAGVHGAVLAYLEIRKENFYSIRQELDGKRFVTARGWEDLSRVLQVYEEMQLAVTAETVSEYLGDEEIAKDFALYYELYHKYRDVYRVPEILRGSFPEDTEHILSAPFDERLSLLSLLIDALNQEFRQYAEELSVQRKLFEVLSSLREALEAQKETQDGESGGQRETASELLRRVMAERREKLRIGKEAKLLGRREEREEKLLLQILEEMEKMLRSRGRGAAASDFALLKETFTLREEERRRRIEGTGSQLSNAFEFLSRTFGEGQELVIFLSELSAGYYSLKFVSECGNDAYYRYNQFLLLRDQRTKLREDVLRMMEL